MARILTNKAVVCSGRTGKIGQNEICCSALKGTDVCWEIQNLEEVAITKKEEGGKNTRALIVRMQNIQNQAKDMI